MRIKNVFPWHSNKFDSMRPIQLLKTYEKNVYKCIGILYENDEQQAYTVV